MAGIACNNCSLNELVGVFLHNHAVFKSAWFAFICITAKVARLVVLGEKAPLHTCRKTCSTAPTQPRFLDQFNQFIWLIFFDRPAKCFIPPVLTIAIECIQSGHIYVFCNDEFWHTKRVLIPYNLISETIPNSLFHLSTKASTISSVMFSTNSSFT